MGPPRERRLQDCRTMFTLKMGGRDCVKGEHPLGSTLSIPAHGGGCGMAPASS